MGYTSVLVYVEDVDSADSRVVLACDLAKLFDARLIGVSASIPTPPVMQPYPGGAMIGLVWAQEQQIAEQGGAAGRGALSQHWGRSLPRVGLEGSLV
jgi:hypothetical protein